MIGIKSPNEAAFGYCFKSEKPLKPATKTGVTLLSRGLVTRRLAVELVVFRPAFLGQ